MINKPAAHATCHIGVARILFGICLNLKRTQVKIRISSLQFTTVITITTPLCFQAHMVIAIIGQLDKIDIVGEIETQKQTGVTAIAMVGHLRRIRALDNIH